MSGGNYQPGGNPQYRPNPQQGQYGAQPQGGYAQPGGYPQQHPQQPYGVQGQYPQQGAYRSYAKPHRGGMLLAFGICAWAVCAIFGIIAFFMAKTDLAEMRAGIMDPAGEGMTKAGYYLGMINMIFVAVILVFYVVLFVIVGASGGFR